MLAFELAMGLFFGLGFLQGGKLGFGEDDAVLGHFGLQSLEALLHRFEIVPEPDAAHARGRNGEPALAELVGDAHLAERRLLDGKFHNGAFDLLGDAVLEHRLLPGDFGERDLAALRKAP